MNTPEAVTNIAIDLLTYNEDSEMFLAVGEKGTWDAECGTTVELSELQDGTYSVVRGRKRYSVEVDIKRKRVTITRTK